MSALTLVPSREAFSPVEVGFPVVVSGGQAVAHAPLQVEVELVSASNRYSVRPDPSTRICPSAELAAFSMAAVPVAVGDALIEDAAPDDGDADDADADAELDVDVELDVELDPELLEQPAARATRAAAPVATATTRFMSDFLRWSHRGAPRCGRFPGPPKAGLCP